MDSLLLGSLELLGTTTNPEYRLGQGLDLGAPQPDQATISSILLDGDVVSGDRYRNRTINLSVRIFSNLDARLVTIAQIRAALTLYSDTLAQAVAAKTFTLQWTPDGGLPVIFDCYRGTATRQRTIVGDNQQVTLVTLTFQAKPFGRSPDAQSLTVTSTLQVDSFDTAPTGGTLDTTTKYEGTGSARYTSGSPVSRTFAAKDLSPYDRVTLKHYGITNSNLGYVVSANISLTLTSASGSTTYSGTVSGATRSWVVATLLFSAGRVTSGTGVTLSAVTGYSLTLTATNILGITQLNVDDLRAGGAAQAQVSTTHGVQILAPGVVGSARAPVNLVLTNGATFGQYLFHSPPSSQDPAAAILTALNASLADQTITIAAANAKFAGTYALLLTEAAGGGTDTVTVTVTQLENGSAVGAAKTLTTSYAYTGGNYLIPVGQVTLPLYDVPADNTKTTFTVRVQSSGATRFNELMLLDTAGQTIYTAFVPAHVSAGVYIDEPSPVQSASNVYSSASDRTAAYNTLADCSMSGGPVLFQPGANKVLAWIDSGTPALIGTYYPRWLDERVA